MLQTGHVLVVDDDADTREMLRRLVAGAGFHVVAAEDGLEALHLLRAVRHHAPTVPCLVLLDLHMPRFGGTEFRRAQLVDPALNGVPVAILSGDTDAPGWARRLGAVAALSKPVDPDVLLAVVRRHCGAPAEAEHIADRRTPVPG